MASDKAWYWLAAGVLALGINGAYQDGEFQWAHRIADRSAVMVQQVRNEGCRLVAIAETLLGRDSSGVERAQDQLARVQDRLSHRQMERMQRQMEMAQYQVERAQRVVEMQQDEPCSHSHRFMVKLPEVNVPAVNVRAFVPNVNVPAVTVPRIDVPTVRIPDVKIPPVHVQVDNDDDDGMI